MTKSNIYVRDTRDERIAQVIALLHKSAIEDLGFESAGTRADNQVELTVERTRLVLWTNCVHAEGRVIVEIHRDWQVGRQDGPRQPGRREIRVSGTIGVREEFEVARAALYNIVRRATAVRP